MTATTEAPVHVDRCQLYRRVYAERFARLGLAVCICAEALLTDGGMSKW